MIIDKRADSDMGETRMEAVGRATKLVGDARAVAVPGLMARLARDPAGTMSQVGALLRARRDLRRCDAVGVLPRLYGRCRVLHGEGRIVIGDRFLMQAEMLQCELAVHLGGTIEIGDSVFLNYGTSVSAHNRVVIGSRTLIGQETLILDCDFHGLSPRDRHASHGTPAPISIGENVWLGARVIVLKGVSIGDNTVVAAGSVVNRDLPANVLAGGSPARVIRPLETD